MAIGVAVYPRGETVGTAGCFPPLTWRRASHETPFERQLRKEPAPEPALSFDQASREDHNELFHDLLSRCTPAAADVRSSTGAVLPSVPGEIARKYRLEQSMSPLGRFACQANISPVTGCWSVLKGRDKAGYVNVYVEDVETELGIDDPVLREQLEHQIDDKFGIRSHKLATMLARLELGVDILLPPGEQVDHLCRNKACCNDHHHELVTNQENNIRRREAITLEAALLSAQTAVELPGTGWLDDFITGLDNTDAGVILATRFGPYRLMRDGKSPAVIFADREPCEVFDNLEEPPPNRYQQPSRARQIGNIAGQQVLKFAA